MGTNEKELFDLMEDEGLEVINVSDIGVTLEGEQVTHAIAMEHWQTKEKCVQLTHGEPSSHDALYWDAKGNWQNDEFDKACGEIVKNF